MSVDFITACYGAYDDLKPPAEIQGVRRWIYVTDVYKQEICDAGYHVVVEPRPHVHNNVAAKVPKFLPHIYSDANISVWVDSSAIIQPTLFGAALNGLDGADWSMFPHPNRQDIGEEVLASRGLAKYNELPLEAQTAYYYSKGYAPQQGLWATGVIARRRTQVNAAFGEAWLREVVRWGFQDQLSFAWLQGVWDLKINKLGDDLWANPHIWFGGHNE